jgi:SAM-dependent methyltransferase
MNRKAHWERIYGSKAADELSWYQAYPEISLALISACDVGKEARIVDIGGGDSTLVDSLLDLGFSDVTVLDISSAALARARERLSDRARLPKWVEKDVTEGLLSQTFVVWHDRAVFHFLTDPDDRNEYLRAMNAAVGEGGQVIIATFGPAAPPKCSGLDVVRYSAETLAAELGQGYELVETLKQVHLTPGGVEQEFVYCRFRRTSER